MYIKLTQLAQEIRLPLPTNLDDFTEEEWAVLEIALLQHAFHKDDRFRELMEFLIKLTNAKGIEHTKACSRWDTHVIPYVNSPMAAIEFGFTVPGNVGICFPKNNLSVSRLCEHLRELGLDYLIKNVSSYAAIERVQSEEFGISFDGEVFDWNQYSPDERMAIVSEAIERVTGELVVK